MDDLFFNDLPDTDGDFVQSFDSFVDDSSAAEEVLENEETQENDLVGESKNIDQSETFEIIVDVSDNELGGTPPIFGEAPMLYTEFIDYTEQLNDLNENILMLHNDFNLLFGIILLYISFWFATYISSRFSQGRRR